MTLLFILVIPFLMSIPVKAESVENNPMNNISVVLQTKQGNGVNIVATNRIDKNGFYEFRNIPTGEFQIMVDIPGLGMRNFYTISTTENHDNIEGNDYVITENGIKTVKSLSNIQPTKPDDSIYQIYPNPTHGLLTIKNEKVTDEYLEIYNNYGKLINRYKVSGIETTINIQDLTNGIYSIRIGNKTTKVVKQ